MTPDPNHRMLLGLAESVRATPCPVGRVRLAFHHASVLAEALASTSCPHAAAAAATLQVGPAHGGTHEWRLARVGPQILVKRGLLDAAAAAWALNPAEDQVRFLVMNAHDAIYAIGVNVSGPAVLFAPADR